MTTRYYLGWFNHGLTDKIAGLLKEDIEDRQSLVMISANISQKHREVIGASELAWLEEAKIKFESYHIIDDEVTREEAHRLIDQASVIFLLGGNTREQNDLLLQHGLMEKIKAAKGLVLGASAGAINMSQEWMQSKDLDGPSKGIGLDDFAVLSHYDLENNLDTIQEDYRPILKEMTLLASNKDCAIRIKGDRLDIVGDVYRVTETSIRKLDETL